MKKMILILIFGLMPLQSRADLWGGDLPLLAQIVTNTLNTMMELQKQRTMMEEEMAGIKDKIYRIQTIANVVQPSSWNQWKDPSEALRRLRIIYHTLPPDYKSAKSDMIEQELSRAMSMISGLSAGAETSFRSGKELESRGADASPGVAQKLTASGVGSLIALESQTQVIQSHITSLLAQMLAEGNERETRAIATRGSSFKNLASNLNQSTSSFSEVVLGSK